MALVVVRNDVGKGKRTPPPVPTPEDVARNPRTYAPGFVYFDCPECGRRHLVTLGPCPSHAAPVGKMP